MNRALLPLLCIVALGCPGEPEPPDGGSDPDAGPTDAGAELTFFASEDAVLSKSVVTYEGLITTFDQVEVGGLELRSQVLGAQAFVVTALTHGTDAGLLALGSTKAGGADLIYDPVQRSFSSVDAVTVLGALGESGHLPTALHANDDGSFLLVATSIRGGALKYDLTFREVAPAALGTALQALSAEGFAVVAATIRADVALIGARVRGGGVAYEHRTDVASLDPDAGLPDLGPTVSAFGPAGFIVSSLLVSGDTVYVVGARRAGERPSRINTPRIAPLDGAQRVAGDLGFDNFLLFDVDRIDGGYVMLGTR